MRVVVCALLCVLGTVTVAAHDGARQVSPSLWDLAGMAGLGAAGLLYALGSRRLADRGARIRRAERVAFWIGWATLVIAVAPPLDSTATVLFSAHMAQHELLMLVGAPLVIVGRPIVAWLWALPPTASPAVGNILTSPAVANAWRWLTTPLVACTLHGISIWVWHLPALYERAVVDEGVHALQHATFVGTAVLFWWGLIYGRYGRVAYGASALYVFVTSVHTGILGAMFALSTAPFYPLYASRAAGARIDAVADQQLAGLYMWIPAGVVLTLFGLLLVVAWLAEAERRTAPRER
jgi:putative membrane protein